jgi:uncharacterized protein
VTTLLDANVLIALLVPDHVHHPRVSAWWVARERAFATSPSTQGSLLRFLVREGRSVPASLAVLTAVAGHAEHVFWPDSLSYDVVALRGITGHRQVTDAYLAALARAQGGSVATLDGGFAALHPDVVTLVDPG